jgi:hypothetical protein
VRIDADEQVLRKLQSDEPCGCHHCALLRQDVEALSRLFVCPDCGNKHCPKASWHGYDCTGSDEPGQLGSIYR